MQTVVYDNSSIVNVSRVLGGIYIFSYSLFIFFVLFWYRIKSLPNKKKTILHYKAIIHPVTRTTPSIHHPGAFPTATFDACEKVPAVIVDVEDRVVAAGERVSEFVVVLVVDPPDDVPVAPEAEVEEEADVVAEAEVVVDGDVVGVVATEAPDRLANISVTVEDPVPLGSGAGVFVHASMRLSSMLNLSHSGTEEQLQNPISAHGSQEKSNCRAMY